MSNPIGTLIPISPITPVEMKEMSSVTQAGNKSGADFSSFLNDALNKLDSTQMEAEQAAVAMATGQTEDFHTPVIAMEKASLTLGLAVTVRNKVLDAYHEIMRMQI